MTLDELRTAIRQRCKERGWSVMDVAQKTEVSPEAIRRFMTGGANLKPTTVMRIARALGIEYRQ